jgi:hypothetical protein
MARINLSIPDDLRTRMTALEKHFNWSEVAAAAFEREIAKATFDEDKMDTVIERLRASKNDYERDQRSNGLTAGEAWAKNVATFRDFKKLARLWQDVDDGVVRYDEDDEFSLGVAVDRKLGRNPRDAIEDSMWFEPEDGSMLVPSNDYVMAFLEGVSNVWDEVADKL